MSSRDVVLSCCIVPGSWFTIRRSNGAIPGVGSGLIVSSEPQGGIRIGIDIGGTFTDFLLFDEASGQFSIGKTLTTPLELASAVRTGLVDLLAAAGKQPQAVEQIVHGTTLVTNALIERK